MLGMAERTTPGIAPPRRRMASCRSDRSPRREPVDRRLRVAPRRLERDRRKPGLVGRIGEVLGLEADARVALVAAAALADDRAVEEVAGVALHARLGGVHLHHPAAGGVLEPRAQRESP